MKKLPLFEEVSCIEHAFLNAFDSIETRPFGRVIFVCSSGSSLSAFLKANSNADS